MRHFIFPDWISYCLAGFAILFASPQPNAKADMVVGMKAFQKKDYESARAEFEKASKAGDVMATHALGTLYFEGLGVDKDLPKAAKLFTEAADGGFRAAQWSAGLMYREGNGVKKDIPQAIKYFKLCAEGGDPRGDFALGQIYRTADGVAKNPAKAFVYFEKAALAGYVPAFNEYGLLHVEGIGVKQDFIEAYAWIALAVELKDPPAAQNLQYLIGSVGDDLPDRGAHRLGTLRKKFDIEAPKKK